MNLNHPLPIEPVQILPFPNFDNLQPLMPEEIQYDDLLGFLNDPVTGPAQIHQDNINIGFAQILQPDADLGCIQILHISQALKRLGRKHYCPNAYAK